MNRKQLHEAYNRNMLEWERLDDMVDIDNLTAIEQSEGVRDGLVRQFVQQWNAAGENAQLKVVEKNGKAIDWDII